MHAAHTLPERSLLGAGCSWHSMGGCATQTGQGRCALGKLQSGATPLQWLLLPLTTCPHFHKCMFSQYTFFQDDGFSIIICFLICLLSLVLMKVIFLFRSISFRQMPSLRVLAMPLSHTAYTSILFTSSCYPAHVTKRELHRDPLRFFLHT